MSAPARDHVHLIGIGGSGMSALADVLLGEGVLVSGSDQRRGPVLERLRSLGVRVFEGHDAAHLEGASFVVHSTAIRDDNPELAAARSRGLRCFSRGDMVARILRGRRTVAVSGSHGKSSTTALIAHVLLEAGLDPTILVGAPMAGLGSGGRAGRGELAVVEADESDGSFLLLEPAVAVVTNVDHEHLDHFGGFTALENAFGRFLERRKPGGLAVLCHDDPSARMLAKKAADPVCTYGTFQGLAYSAHRISQEGLVTRFDLRRRGELVGRGTVPLPGAHYALNAVAAIATVAGLGVEPAEALQHLATFRGLERRFNVVGMAGGVTIVDDYGHHPAEIVATLGAARAAFPGRRLLVVFEPHRYTRTRDLLAEFPPAFEQADALLLMPVYAAGERPIAGASGKDLAEVIASRRQVLYLDRIEDVVRILETTVEPGDVVVTLGAGDVTEVGPALLRKLEAEEGG